MINSMNEAGCLCCSVNDMPVSFNISIGFISTGKLPLFAFGHRGRISDYKLTLIFKKENGYDFKADVERVVKLLEVEPHQVVTNSKIK